ncbi:MAG: hypothetical protein C4527_06955 [Candidatus Omnitrophota bacterium]|jgi:AAA15 family ATPase/GTPase|nr:MAG: hypothetical protein C4527_06955 [Candidatus Omnitrophota bacterium]
MLPSLEIKNFRTFEHLTIEKLAQVNLITGKNNVGKTTLLEAVNFYIYKGSPHVLREIVNPQKFIEFADHLFYGYNGKGSRDTKIEIGPISEDSSKKLLFFIEEGDHFDPWIKILYANKTTGTNFFQYMHSRERDVKSYFISSNEKLKYLVYNWWDDLVLDSTEYEIIAELENFYPGIERIALVSDPELTPSRFFMAKLKNNDMKVSFASFGGGIEHILSILIAMFNAQNGTLLIDEIENGLHYSIQPEIWGLIVKLAKRLNVQVFATTHSWDCITAFQEAVSENNEVTSQLIRLSRLNGKIRTTIFEASELPLITQAKVEVR